MSSLKKINLVFFDMYKKGRKEMQNLASKQLPEAITNPLLGWATQISSVYFAPEGLFFSILYSSVEVAQQKVKVKDLGYCGIRSINAFFNLPT